MARFNTLDPRNLLVRTRFSYEKLPGAESQASSPIFNGPLIKSLRHRNSWANRIQRPRMSIARVLCAIVTAVVVAVVFGMGIYTRHHPRERSKGEGRKLYHWEHYPR